MNCNLACMRGSSPVADVLGLQVQVFFCDIFQHNITATFQCNVIVCTDCLTLAFLQQGFEPWIILLVSYTLCYLSCPCCQKECGSVAKTA